MTFCDRGTSCWLGLLLCVAIAGSPAQSAAQRLIPSDRPADDRLPEPTPAEVVEESGPILPPYPVPKPDAEEGIWSGAIVFIEEIRVVGNLAISDSVLREIARPYEQRNLDYGDLIELRERLTLAYLDRGYLTSGAVLAADAIEAGVLTIEIVEGHVSEIEIQNDGSFRDHYFRSRLVRPGDGAANLVVLERRLRLLQQDPRIERIEASLQPGRRRDIATLRVRVHEASQLSASIDFDNHRSPNIGSLGGQPRIQYDNVFGVGDTFIVRGAFSEGLRQLEGVFSVPLTRWGTLLTLRYRWSDTDVVNESVASSLDIESSSRTIALELRQPLYQSVNTSLYTFLRGELRRAKSYLDGGGFSFVSGPEDGLSKVSALRWGIGGSTRSREQALAFQSLVSFGLDAFDATINRAGVADGQFIAWLLQAHWIRRLGLFDAELLVRADLQLANSRLLPLEQFALGGHGTVRGYRENRLVRDSGFVGSVEVRVPLYRRIEPNIEWSLVPFFDIGRSWNAKGHTRGEQTLASIGVGTRLRFQHRFRGELFWGHRLRDVQRFGERDLQDSGVHFRIGMDWY